VSDSWRQLMLTRGKLEAFELPIDTRNFDRVKSSNHNNHNYELYKDSRLAATEDNTIEHMCCLPPSTIAAATEPTMDYSAHVHQLDEKAERNIT